MGEIFFSIQNTPDTVVPTDNHLNIKSLLLHEHIHARVLDAFCFDPQLGVVAAAVRQLTLYIMIMKSGLVSLPRNFPALQHLAMIIYMRGGESLDVSVVI
jgi:hypothetical protein